MMFDEVWREVQGLPDSVKMQVPEALSEATKKMLNNQIPEEVAAIVTAAMDEVNHGSVEHLDTLIKKRL